MNESLFMFGMSLLGIVILVPIALTVLRYMLRSYDKSLKISFREVYEKIMENPMAAAIYFGMRFVGASIVCAALFDKWVF